jgi:hypothetical protein
MPNRRPRSKALHRIAGGVGALLVLGGCGPTFEIYRYISLEGYPNARVVERAQATPGEHRFFVGEIPTRYEIEREGYTLVIAVHPNNWGPGIRLTIRPFPERRVGAERYPSPCTEWTGPNDEGWLGYTIYPLCFKGDPWEKVDKHLRFRVLDADGTVVTEEDIPYTIKRDGFFMYMDAI